MTEKNELPACVRNYLTANPGITSSDVIGGTAIISEAVKVTLPNATRHAGYSAYDTNNKVIQDFVSSIKFDQVYVANGVTGIDALAGAPLAAQTKSAIVLTDGVGAVAGAFVNGKITSNSVVTALGGTAVVSARALAGIYPNTYVTLLALTAAFPSGNTNIYVVAADGNWYYWRSTVWISGGLYQSEEIPAKVSSPNLFNKSKIVKGFYISWESGNMTALSTHCVSNFISIKPITVYTRSNIEQFAFYNSNKVYISGFSPFDHTFTTPAGSYYMRLSVRLVELQTMQIEQGSVRTPYNPYTPRVSLHQVAGLPISNYVIVDKTGGDYVCIQDAVDDVDDSSSNPVTIIIRPGIYKEHLSLIGRDLSLVGMDRDTCIIQDDSGDYYKAPLTISGNAFISNLTFISTHDNGTTYKIPSYAVHCDSAGAGLLTFSNCKLTSYQNSAIGIGMQQNQTLVFADCEFRKNASYNGGSFYCHNDQFSNVLNQHLIIKIFNITTNLGYAMKIDDANTYNGGTNSPMDIALYNNVLYSDEKGVSDIVLFRDAPLNGGISGQIKLVQDSSGNNISSLNA